MGAEYVKATGNKLKTDIGADIGTRQFFANLPQFEAYKQKGHLIICLASADVEGKTNGSLEHDENGKEEEEIPRKNESNNNNNKMDKAPENEVHGRGKTSKIKSNDNGKDHEIQKKLQLDDFKIIVRHAEAKPVIEKLKRESLISIVFKSKLANDSSLSMMQIGCKDSVYLFDLLGAGTSEILNDIKSLIEDYEDQLSIVFYNIEKCVRMFKKVNIKLKKNALDLVILDKRIPIRKERITMESLVNSVEEYKLEYARRPLKWWQQRPLTSDVQILGVLETLALHRLTNKLLSICSMKKLEECKLACYEETLMKKKKEIITRKEQRKQKRDMKAKEQNEHETEDSESKTEEVIVEELKKEQEEVNQEKEEEKKEEEEKKGKEEKKEEQEERNEEEESNEEERNEEEEMNEDEEMNEEEERNEKEEKNEDKKEEDKVELNISKEVNVPRSQPSELLDELKKIERMNAHKNDRNKVLEYDNTITSFDADLKPLLDVLPPVISEALQDRMRDAATALYCIALDLGQPVTLIRLDGAPVRLLTIDVVTESDLNVIRENLGPSLVDRGSCSVGDSLHICHSLLDYSSNALIGVSFRVQRAMAGVSSMVQDLVDTKRNILVVGVGKTTLLRDIVSRSSVSETQVVFVLDNKGEIGGLRPQSHSSLGMVRRVIPKKDDVAVCAEDVLLKHAPNLVVLDEIRHKQDCEVALTARLRQIQLICGCPCRTFADLHASFWFLRNGFDFIVESLSPYAFRVYDLTSKRVHLRTRTERGHEELEENPLSD